VTALKHLDNEFEAVSGLKVPFYKLFWRVTVPVCPAVDHRHQPVLFRHASDDDFGGRVSVLPKTVLASISIVQLD